MGLAPYGRPIYHDVILEKLIDLKPDGSFWLDMTYFNYCQGLTMTNRRFHDLFGGPPRSPESMLEQRHMDLAASIQAVTEEVVLRIGRHLQAADRAEAPGPGRWRGPELRRQRLAAALRDRSTTSGSSPPRATPAGPWGRPCSSGTNCWASPATPAAAMPERAVSWARCFSAIGDRPAASGPTKARPAGVSTTEADLLEHVAQTLAEGKIVGWFHGRMEFGPRALGARSIIGDPR